MSENPSAPVTRKDLHIYYYDEVNPKSILDLVNTLREATLVSLDKQLLLLLYLLILNWFHFQLIF